MTSSPVATVGARFGELTESDSGAPENASVAVEVDHVATLNFAMEQSGVPIVSAVRVVNRGSTPLDGLAFEVALAPDLGDPVVVSVPTILGGEYERLGSIDLRLPPGRLRTISEAERARLTWRLLRGDQTLAEGAGDIDLLAYNEWPGARAPAPLLAVFSTPNHPVIARILKRVSDRLSSDTGDASLPGYQRGDPQGVLAQIRALYATIQDLGITYVGTPASFEAQGQKVRLPDVLLDQQIGNCLDITLLFSSCMEQMGLGPLLVMVRGHAFPAVWLIDERFPECTVDDAARVRTQIALRQILVFDSSTALLAGRPPLEAAVAEAERRLQRDEEFGHLVDVRVARVDRYRPLPIRMTIDSVADDEVAQSDRRRVTELLAEAWHEPETPSAPGTPAPAPDSVMGRFKRWKERLLDLSLRNKLLNFRQNAQSGIPLRVPALAEFEDALAGQAVFEILPRPENDVRDQRSAELLDARADEHERLVAELRARRLYAPLAEHELAPRARSLYRDARNDLEEGGVSTLYAVLGTLKWYETSSSDAPRFAPLLLLPVHLDYEPRGGRILLKRTDDEAIGNVTLAEKMKRDFGLDLGGLIDIALDDSGVDVPRLLRQVRQGIQRMPRWEVIEDVALGTFTFAKFLMWRDLDENSEALLANPVVRHIAEGGQSLFPDSVGEPAADQLDDAVSPGDLPTVVDADSTQLAAVVAALKGRSFVLQGPPGTGKSQTITNLIAAALGAGKTVLFVSEKMAALEVVHRRLKQVGLEDFCLELHSNKANKKDALKSFGRSYARTRAAQDPAWQARSQAIGDQRAALNGYVRALHSPRALGTSLYHASARLLELGRAPVIAVPLASAVDLAAARRDELLAIAQSLSLAARRIEPVSLHPWRDSKLVEWSSTLEDTVRETVNAALSSLKELELSVVELARSGGCTAPRSLEGVESLALLAQSIGAGPTPAAALDDRWIEIERQARAWIELAERDEAERAELTKRWRAELFDLDLGDLRARFERRSHSNSIVAWFALRNPRKTLGAVARGDVASNASVLADLALAIACVERLAKLAVSQDVVAAATAGCWSPASDGRDVLRRVLDRATRLRSALQRYRAIVGEPPATLVGAADPIAPSAQRDELAAKGAKASASASKLRVSVTDVERATVASSALPLSNDAEYTARLRTVLESWRDSIARLRDWCLYGKACAQADANGLGAAVEAHRAHRLTAKEVRDAVERSILERWVAAVRDAEPVLRDFDGEEHDDLVRRFRSEDRAHLQRASDRIAALIDARRPPGLADASEGSEPGILNRELMKKTRHMALRKLFQQIPNLVARLKPCVLMSPLSVAQYLPADGRRFDLVVFDEASQIGTHDAIGAIARGNQVIIVGDSKQLPPTAFFCRDFSGDREVIDDNDIEELESILDEALAVQVPQQSLGWHYRSRHETLIDFSNRNYYEDRLSVFPSARGQVDDLGVKWTRVPDGIYEKGRTRTNPREARVLVDWLVGELVRTPPGGRSFGVVTFSLPQQTLVMDLLDEARAANPEIEGHFSEQLLEPVFVKNLENVQGDERDDILFSVCYGPDEHGRVHMNFGPLNRSGGERRLNVAITRARCALRVFSTLTHEMIDLARTQAVGARHLRAFLQFASERGAAIARGRPTTSAFESEFEREVHDVLTSRGYEVDCQVGCSGYRIDLAVRHPGRPGEYAIGIECDGRPYHSGATARDRDRLRQQVLENLGWRLHRIWSTDWWFQRDRVIEHMLEQVDAAIANERTSPVAPAIAPTPAPVAPPAADSNVAPPGPEDAPDDAPEGPPTEPYRVSTLEPISNDPEDLYEPSKARRLRAALIRVLELEAPIHRDDLARRVAVCFGIGRVTERVREFLERQFSQLQRDGELAMHGDFIWAGGVAPSDYAAIRVSEPEGESRDFDSIPIEELANAARWYLSRSLSLPLRDLSRSTARVFGVRSLGKRVEERMQHVVAHLVTTGHARVEGDRVAWLG